MGLRDEAVPAARDGDDVAMFSGADAKRLAQCRSGLGQIVFFDHPACPYGGKQFVFADRPVTVLDQVHQHVQRLGRERDRTSAPVLITQFGADGSIVLANVTGVVAASRLTADTN